MSSGCGIVVDIESSGLGADSYPIQIGWCSLDLQVTGCFLIRPAKKWTSWDEQSEAVHNIDRVELDAGLSVHGACIELVQVLSNERIYSDSPFDQFWLNQLFTAGGWANTPIRVNHVADLVRAEARSLFNDELESRPRSHNALRDARLIASLVMRPQYYGSSDY